MPSLTQTQSITSLAPSYHTLSPRRASPNPNDSDAIELALLSTTSLPTYDSLAPADQPFLATQQLRIDTMGTPLIAWPAPTRPIPIPIYDLTNLTSSTTPLYVSFRPKRSSGTCHLIHGTDTSETPTILCTTTYKFGPGKPPVISLRDGIEDYEQDRPSTSQAGPSSSHSDTVSRLSTETDPPQKLIETTVTSPHFFHRTQQLRTPYGTFTWRYASKSERRALSQETDCLLVMDHVVRVALPGGKSQDVRTPVARFLRGADTRTLGTSRSTAGNGGVLELDLRRWIDAKDDVEMVRRLAVASCVCMLKKEVDRRRVHQAMAIGAMASG